MQEEEYTIPQMVEDVRAGRMPRRRFIRMLTAIGISAAGVGAIAAAAAHPFVAQSVSHGSVQEAPEKQIQLHDAHLAHQSQGDTSALHNDYAEGAVVEDSMHAQPFVGRAAILARKNVGFAAIPDLKIQLTNRVVHGNQVCAEWIASGTHTGDFPALPASGRPFSIHGVTVVVRQQEKIVRESIYYDMAEVRRQLSS